MSSMLYGQLCLKNKLFLVVIVSVIALVKYLMECTQTLMWPRLLSVAWLCFRCKADYNARLQGQETVKKGEKHKQNERKI